MPKDMKEMMDYESMLDELAQEYPKIKQQAMDLKDDLMELMPLDAEEEEIELSLEEEDEEAPELELSL